MDKVNWKSKQEPLSPRVKISKTGRPYVDQEQWAKEKVAAMTKPSTAQPPAEVSEGVG